MVVPPRYLFRPQAPARAPARLACLLWPGAFGPPLRPVGRPCGPAGRGL